jgi:Skp family chaperone for outer membrane proteins
LLNIFLKTMILITLNSRTYIKFITMKTKLLFLIAGLSLMLLPLQTSAQERSADRIKAIKVAYITERLSLTPEEAEVFWPVYNEFENRKMEINHSKREIGEKFSKNQESLSDAEINKMLDEGNKLNKEEADLIIQFDKKFREILPPAKVMKLYIAEVQFRNYLINKFREQHPRHDNNKD